MNKDDLILVSVDDHVVEPPDVFEKHLPAKYQEFAPKLKERPDGTLAWYYYEHEITNVGLNAVAGRPREEYGIEPTRLDEMRQGPRRLLRPPLPPSRRTRSRSASRRCTIRTGTRSGERARSGARSSACTSARRRSWR
jgi:hypothetical protein